MHELKRWARVERRYLDAELELLEAGAKLISPSGDDITADKMAELRARSEHATLVLNGMHGT